MLSTLIVPWASLFVDTDIIVEHHADTLRIGINLRAHTQRQMLDLCQIKGRVLGSQLRQWNKPFGPV